LFRTKKCIIKSKNFITSIKEFIVVFMYFFVQLKAILFCFKQLYCFVHTILSLIETILLFCLKNFIVFFKYAFI